MPGQVVNIESIGLVQGLEKIGKKAIICLREPALGPIPDRVYLGIVHGTRQLVCDALEAKSRPRLRALAPDIHFMIEATVRGAAAAQA